MQISINYKTFVFYFIFVKNRKTPEPLKELDSTKKIIVYTTLIRDQNGLGFSIAGGKGCSPFKENNEVIILKKYINYII